jgi:hypothetical protein
MLPNRCDRHAARGVLRRGHDEFSCTRAASASSTTRAFAEPLRERIRQRAQEVCSAAGVQIEHVNKTHIRKEDLVARVLATRGDASAWCT